MWEEKSTFQIFTSLTAKQLYIYPSSLKVGIRTEELLLQNPLPFDRSFLCVVAVVVSSSFLMFVRIYDIGGKDHLFSFKKGGGGESRKRMTALAMHSCAYVFSLTSLILQSLLKSTDLAGCKRRSYAFKDEISYLDRCLHRYSTLGPDTAAVLGADI